MGRGEYEEIEKQTNKKSLLIRDVDLAGKGGINMMTEESFTPLEQLIAQGEELGCSGEELKRFVEGQVSCNSSKWPKRMLKRRYS